MRKYFLALAVILLLIIAPMSVFTQGNTPVSKTDSLSKLLLTDAEDTSKVIHLNALAWELKYQNPDTAIVLSKQALALASKIAGTEKNQNVKLAAQKGISKAYGNLGVYYYFKSEIGRASCRERV